MTSKHGEFLGKHALRSEQLGYLATVMHIVGENSKDRPLSRHGVSDAVILVLISFGEIIDRPQS